MTSLELSEWEAYERHAGPLGTSWQDEALGSIHEQLQRLNRIQGAAHFTDRKHKKNPVPEPKRFTRPYEIFESADTEPEDDEFDDDAITEGRDFGTAEPTDQGGELNGDSH